MPLYACDNDLAQSTKLTVSHLLAKVSALVQYAVLTNDLT